MFSIKRIFYLFKLQKLFSFYCYYYYGLWLQPSAKIIFVNVNDT